MSDFTDFPVEESNGVETFCPKRHINDICAINKISLKVPIVDYKMGWAPLIETMLNSLKGQNIILISITTTYGQLDSEFVMAKGVTVAKVYKAIEVARIESRIICMECGKLGFRHFMGNKVVVICRICEAVIDSNGETGTWLDKY